MHILLVNSLYPPHVLGGTELYVKKLAAQLLPEHRVSILTTTPYQDVGSLHAHKEADGNVDLYRFYPLNFYHLTNRPNSSAIKAAWYTIDLFNPHAWLEVRNLLDHLRPDIVHTHNLRGMSPSAVWHAIKSKGLPLAHTLHDYYLICRNSMLLADQATARICTGDNACTTECRFYGRVTRPLLDGKPDLVMGPSQFVVDMHQQRGLFTDTRTAVLRLWSDSPPLVPAPSLTSGPLHVLYIGAISRHKGVRHLVQAVRALPNLDLQLDIVGNGDQEVDVSKQLAGDDERIHFYTFLSGEAKEAAFARADVVALPAVWYDNAPATIMESFVRGKPVVASQIGGIPEFVQHNYNGLLVPPGDVMALAAQLEMLYFDRTKCLFLAQNALETSKTYTPERHLDAITELYRTLIESVL